MKNLDTIINEFKSEAIDGRDTVRIAHFVPEDRLPEIGLTLKPEYVGKHEHVELTRENVMDELKRDLAFAFEKALDKRGISADCMFWVIKMWDWILEDGLENWSEDDYAQYGLPLFKATALKYGLDNPIGDDDGTEFKYSSDSDD